MAATRPSASSCANRQRSRDPWRKPRRIGSPLPKQSSAPPNDADDLLAVQPEITTVPGHFLPRICHILVTGPAKRVNSRDDALAERSFSFAAHCELAGEWRFDWRSSFVLSIA